MAERCTAVTLMRDDQWGGFRMRCERGAGHDGHHRVEMAACEPLAGLSWDGTYVPRTVATGANERHRG